MNRIKILSLLFVSVAMILCAEDVPESYEACAQRLEKKCNSVIDDIFTQARESIMVKKNIITPEWLAREEIEEIQNLLSDACIELVFDHKGENIIPARLEIYVEEKIREELSTIFACKDVSVKGVDQFFDLAKIVCALSQISDCNQMVRSIKNDHFIPLQKIKFEKKLKKKAHKDQMRELREGIILGAYPRK